jgi:hypothetical protein
MKGHLLHNIHNTSNKNENKVQTQLETFSNH